MRPKSECCNCDTVLHNLFNGHSFSYKDTYHLLSASWCFLTKNFGTSVKYSLIILSLQTATLRQNTKITSDNIKGFIHCELKALLLSSRYTMAAQDLVMRARGVLRDRGWRITNERLGSGDDISVFIIPLMYGNRQPWGVWQKVLLFKDP